MSKLKTILLKPLPTLEGNIMSEKTKELPKSSDKMNPEDFLN